VFNLTSYKASGTIPLPPPPAGGALAAPFGGVTGMRAGPDGSLSFDAWIPLKAGDTSLQLLWALGDGWALPVPAAAHVRGALGGGEGGGTGPGYDAADASRHGARGWQLGGAAAEGSHRQNAPRTSSPCCVCRQLGPGRAVNSKP
jgi:hypothetical protein